MRNKTNHTYGRLVALLTVVVAVVGILGLMPKFARADDGTAHSARLVLRNTLVGDDRAFKFTITTNGMAKPGVGFETPTIEEVVPDESSPDPSLPKYTVELKNDQKVAFEAIDGVPLEYTIEQESEEGWTPFFQKGDEGITNGTITKGTVPDGSEEKVEYTDVQIAIDGMIDPMLIQLPVTEDQTLTDTVYVMGMVPGRSYGVDGTLIAPDEEVVGGASTTITVPDNADITQPQEISLPLSIDKEKDVEKYAGQKLVSMVDVKDVTDQGAPAEFVKLENADDADQTVVVKEAEVPPAATGTLVISKVLSTPKTDEAIAEAQKAVDEAQGESEKQAAEAELKALNDLKAEAEKEEFVFSVKLTDKDGKELETDYPYTVGDKTETLTKGVGTITLKGGEKATIPNLPEGTAYEVAEAKALGWTTEVEKKDGDLSAGEPTEVVFTNRALGSFSISKAIENAETDELKATEFTFTVHVYKSKDDRTDVEGEFSYIGTKQGTLKSGDTVALKGGEMVSFDDLEPGYYVVVEESPADGWKANHTSLGGEIRELKVRTADYVNTYGTSDDNTSSNGNNNNNKSSGSGTVRRSSTGGGSVSTGSKTSTSSNSTLAKTADPSVGVMVLGVAALGFVGLGRASRKNR